jgi:hypothetical protein
MLGSATNAQASASFCFMPQRLDQVARHAPELAHVAEILGHA